MSDLAAALALVRSEELEERCRGVEELARIEGEAAASALAALLAEPSWYLRDRVVEAIAARPDAAPAVRRVLAGGSWFARASACDALGRGRDPEALPALLQAMEDRNVSLQKSAAAAVRRLGERVGVECVARELARLPAERRRRVITRLGHQEPHWIEAAERALAALEPANHSEPLEPAWSGGRAEVRALARFRRWIAALPGGAAR
ncbi:MAG: HEAT repeat domain-containing protein [Gemmatimonadetes bacterium]|nr:HEAT repeat domain-containing protein [Gemmatimonadota bacterium]